MAVAVAQAVRYNEKHRNSLLHDLNSERFEDENLCDATLQVDGKSFSIHRCIVGKVSLYFRQLFKVEMKEKYALFANMEGFTRELMESILNYIYTGSVDINDENVLDLVAASEYLLIEDLNLFCRDHFVKNVTVENCLKYYKFANDRKWALLKRKAEDVFVKNFGVVSKQAGFASLLEDDLEYLLPRVDQDSSAFRVMDVFESVSRWVKYDVEQRKRFLPKLMNLVKFHQLSSINLATLIEEDSVQGFPEVKNLLKEEIEWRLYADAEVNRNRKGFVLVEGTNVQLFDAFSETYTKLADLPNPPVGSCLAIYQDSVFVIGGEQDNATLIRCLNLDEEQASWESVGQTLEDRNCASAIASDDVIFISGGRTGAKSVETYRQIGSEVQQTLIQPMNHARYGHVMIKCCGLIYCFGGNKHTLTEVYSKQTWKVAIRQQRVMSCAAVAINNLIYVIITGRPVNVYDTESNVWQVLGCECPFSYQNFSACHVEGKIYTYGTGTKISKVQRLGSRSNSTCQVAFAEYNVVRDTWRILMETQYQASPVFYASM